jgi:pilus assembly protein CpaC
MNPLQLTRKARRLNPILSGIVLIALSRQAPAQTAPATEPATPAVITAAQQTAPVALTIGRTSTVTAPWPVKRIAVTDPKVADIQMISPRQVMITGKTAGTTDLLMWNSNEEAITRPVTVAPDHSALQTELARLFPDAKIEVHQSNDQLVINGLFTRAEQAKELHRFLEGANVKYVDATTVAGVQQVQIKVTVAEANRTAIRALGINAFQSGGDFFGGSTIGPDGGGPINPLSIGVPAGTAASGGRLPFNFLSDTSVSPAATLFAGFPDANLQFFVQALAENQYLRVLAEPSLVALSGQEASFLAGGEFPIPVVQGAGSSTSGTSITIEYKEFGVRLRFRPTVMGDGTIRLHVAPGRCRFKASAFPL